MTDKATNLPAPDPRRAWLARLSRERSRFDRALRMLASAQEALPKNNAELIALMQSKGKAEGLFDNMATAIVRTKLGMVDVDLLLGEAERLVKADVAREEARKAAVGKPRVPS